MGTLIFKMQPNISFSIFEQLMVGKIGITQKHFDLFKKSKKFKYREYLISS